MSEKSPLREDLEKLNSLCQDLAKMASRLPSITNQLMYTSMKKSIDDMQAQQNAMAHAIVARSPDEEGRRRFTELSRQIESAEQRVRDCPDVAELKPLAAELESLIETWTRLFQEIVADLMRREKEQSVPN
ncbi:MAG: hypothetical protein ACYCW6_08260 [Candidatus Xenobia bacterium]